MMAAVGGDAVREAAIQLADAMAKLAAATQDYESARERERLASSEETAAHNRLNQAQRKVDEVLAGLKKIAPRDTDWTRVKGAPA